MSNKKVFKRVLEYMGGYKLSIIISIIFALISVGVSLYIPILAGKAIDFIVGKGKVDFVALAPLLLLIGLFAAVSALVQWIMNILNNKVAFRVVRDIRNDAFCKIQNLPLSAVDRKPVGNFVSRIITDADQFADGLILGFTQLFTGIVTILGTLGFMFSVNYKIALIVVVLSPLSVFAAGFISKKTFNMYRLQTESRSKQVSYIEETVNNQKTVISFSRQKKSLEKFDELNEEYEKHSLKALFFSSTVNPSTRFINSLVYAAVGLAGALIALGGGISVGGLTVFLSYATQYTKPFNEISGVIAEFQNALACAERLFLLIDSQEEPPEAENALCLKDVSGNICFKDVGFSYDEKKELIRHFNIKVNEGQNIAIVGPTGCGKTTLINLLMRFWDVNKGEIILDGTDIRNINRKSLRKNIGMVLQETWLKEATVRENIAMGKPDADISEIITASKKCHAHNFIKQLPKGYDTVIDDNCSLSRGQKQLLCVARVMLCLPPVLILDEATSSIDTRTELKIRDAFDEMTKGRTSFIVAHRLSTIKNADLIIVMKDGKITETGNHKELLDKKGFYYKLYNSRINSQ